jgi:hypothetical protein
VDYAIKELNCITEGKQRQTAIGFVQVGKPILFHILQKRRKSRKKEKERERERERISNHFNQTFIF